MDESVPRHLLATCREALADTPILVLQGARQVGKSTLARQLADSQAKFINLDDLSWLDFALEDPEGLVRQNPDGLLVIDEAQRAPGLVLALKAAVDARRSPGSFLLTGSADLFRAPGIGDSLAGRVETVVVAPFSAGELERRRRPEDFVAWLRAGGVGQITLASDLARTVVRGGFPEAVKRSERRADRWFASYVGSLVTHDASEISDGPFSGRLEAMLRWLAAQGQTELVKAKLARQIGVSETTADTYLRLIWDLYLAQSYPSWGLGLAGRETRRPKVSLLDTGLASHLVGFSAEQATRPGGREYYGLLLEQFVAAELRKQQGWSEVRYRVYHFRRRDLEVDLVIEAADGSVILIEVKSSTGVERSSWRSLDAARREFGDRVAACVVFYAGTETLRLHDWLHVLPVSALWRHP